MTDFYSIHGDSKVKSAWLWFIYYWLIFLVGTFIGQFIPPTLRFTISIGIFVLIIISLFVKSQKFGNIISSLLAAGLGIVSYGMFMHYLLQLGAQTFWSTIMMAIAAFTVMGLIGYFVVKDASQWNKFLFPMLIALIIASIVGIFIHATIFHIILTVFSLMIFLLYSIYDFNRMRLNNFEPREMGFNLFINLLNLIMDLLRLVGFLSRD